MCRFRKVVKLSINEYMKKNQEKLYWDFIKQMNLVDKYKLWESAFFKYKPKKKYIGKCIDNEKCKFTLPNGKRNPSCLICKRKS